MKEQVRHDTGIGVVQPDEAPCRRNIASPRLLDPFFAHSFECRGDCAGGRSLGSVWLSYRASPGVRRAALATVAGSRFSTNVRTSKDPPGQRREARQQHPVPSQPPDCVVARRHRLLVELKEPQAKDAEERAQFTADVEGLVRVVHQLSGGSPVAVTAPARGDPPRTGVSPQGSGPRLVHLAASVRRDAPRPERGAVCRAAGPPVHSRPCPGCGTRSVAVGVRGIAPR